MARRWWDWHDTQSLGIPILDDAVAVLKKQFPFLRKLSNTLVEDPEHSIDRLTSFDNMDGSTGPHV
jgi:hypothetical protein